MVQPTQTDPQFKLRLPAGLHARLKVSAETNNRSMNAEIVQRLEASLSQSVIEELAPGQPLRTIPPEAYPVRGEDIRSLTEKVEELLQQLKRKNP